MERRHRRHRARRAVPQPRPLPGVAAGAPRRHAPRGRRAPRRARARSSTTSRTGGPSGCSRPTTRSPACSTTLRDRGVRLVICSNWDWDLEPAIAEAGLAGRFDVVVSSAWAGARKPHPRIYRYLLEQADLDPAERALRGRHVGARRRGTARRRACARRTSSATATGPTRPNRPTRRRHRRHGSRDLTGVCRCSRTEWVPATRTGRRGLRQTTRTFCASSPLRPGPTSNSTR